MKTQFGFLLLGIGFCVACQSSSESKENQAGGTKAPPGWVAHQDPQGFSVRFPRGWKVHAQTSGRVELRGLSGEELIIWPVIHRGSLEMANASEALRRVAATKLWPAAAWERPQPAGATTVRMRGRFGDRATVAVFTWVTSPKGSGGYIYAITAPESSYRQAEDTFAQILQSFRIIGAPSEASPVEQKLSLDYVKWRDPRENAFSLDVPRGWSVNGGLFRFSVIDVRGAVEMISPGGQIRITTGDAEIPTFMEPFSYLGINYPEGTWYQAGYGNNYYIRRYVAGTAFVMEYVQAKVARGCSNVIFIKNATRDREDAARAINIIVAQWASSGIHARMTAGEVAFSCRNNNQLLHGYYFAGTGLAQTRVGNWWRPQYLFGYLAASGKELEAQAALERMLKSYQVNPQWAQMQSNTIAQSSQIIARTNQEISNLISQTYWTRQASKDRISRMEANARRGVDEWVDPHTGRQMTLESGSNYNWVDNRGTILGTETSTTPNVDFRQLVRLP